MSRQQQDRPGMKFLDEDRILDIPPGEVSILDLVLDNDLELDHSCGGMGSCGTCRIIVEKNLHSLAPRNEVESELALDRGFEECERLACQSVAVDGLEFKRPVST